MDTFIHASPFTGYVYPNETIIPWTVLIVVYPYLTGLVAGAFTISSLYQVFGFTQLRPVAHFALLVSLCCMITVPLPLLLHLGHPERAFNAMITPHVTSAFAVFGYAAGFYIILLVLETWFVFRPHIVHQAQQQTGVLRWFYSILSLGSDDLSEKAMRYDRKWLFVLAVIGIPGAHGLHGYVGLRVRFFEVARVVVVRSYAGHIPAVRDHLRHRFRDRPVCRVLQTTQSIN